MFSPQSTQPPQHRFNPASRRQGGFTLVDLCVLLVIVFAGLSCVLPVLTQARLGEREIQCMNNLQKLAAAGLAYANDKGDL